MTAATSSRTVDLVLRVAKIIERTTAEGPHTRMALWVAGCTLRCPGCCNPELFDPNAGEPLSRADLEARLDALRGHIEGITVLGGEPLQQPSAVAELLEAAVERDLGTVVFSGYTLAEARPRPGFDAIWSRVDTLIDGRFDVDATLPPRRYIGSSNQRLIHRTARYASGALWSGNTRIEVRIGPDGRVEAHGLPAPVAKIRRAIRHPDDPPVAKRRRGDARPR